MGVFSSGPLQILGRASEGPTNFSGCLWVSPRKTSAGLLNSSYGVWHFVGLQAQSEGRFYPFGKTRAGWRVVR